MMITTQAVHGITWVLIAFFAVWLPWDLYRWIVKQKTFSQQMEDWGAKHWQVKAAYVVGAVYLYYHFWIE